MSVVRMSRSGRAAPECGETLQAPRVIDVVSVEECNEIGPGRANARVASGGGASILLADELHAILERREGREDVVRRPVVDDDHLLRRHRLSERRLDCSRHRRRRVEGRDHDREARRIRGRDLSSGRRGERAHGSVERRSGPAVVDDDVAGPVARHRPPRVDTLLDVEERRALDRILEVGAAVELDVDAVAAGNERQRRHVAGEGVVVGRRFRIRRAEIVAREGRDRVARAG